MTGRQRAALAVEARRGGLGMSREDLAAKAKIDPKTIYNLEKNGKWPIARTRARIETALGWPDGEMARIAADQQPEPRRIPPDVLAVIGKYPPEQQRDIIEMLGELTGPPSEKERSESDAPGRAG